MQNGQFWQVLGGGQIKKFRCFEPVTCNKTTTNLQADPPGPKPNWFLVACKMAS